MSPSFLLLANVVLAWTLTGLIWTIQVVHYPLLAAVGQDGFIAYERNHCRRISWLVGPLMTVELVAAVGLALASPAPRSLSLIQLRVLAAIWLSTAVVQGPLHQRLCEGYSAAQVDLLVKSNWFRTAAWTLRALLVTILLRTAS